MDVDPTRRTEFTLTLAGSSVPAVLLRPPASEPLPVALLLHAYNSSKERLADTVGRALARNGIASLAIDLPLHGGRDDRLEPAARRNPLELMRQWRLALAEAEDAVAWLAGQRWIARTRVAAVGYSLGSYVAVLTAARAPFVRALVIAAGGDLPATPWSAMLRSLGDPIAAVRALQGRPLLMVHGRSDRTITAVQAQRLFDAAAEPKQLLWYDAGHVLPAAAAADAADWLTAAIG